MRTPITSSQFGELFTSFERSAFRLETLDQYLVEGENREYERFLAGECLPEDRNQAWADLIKANVSSGKTMRRVHLVTIPLSPYLRFQLSWGYPFSDVAGEQISFLDRKRLPDSGLASLGDYWLFDDRQLVMMRYGPDGTYLGAELEDDPQQLATRIEARQQLLKTAIPLREFLAQERKK
jgi:hypothetical protein